jgi:hypothetical protein
MSRILIAKLIHHHNKHVDSIKLLSLYRIHNVFPVRYRHTYKVS